VTVDVTGAILDKTYWQEVPVGPGLFTLVRAGERGVSGARGGRPQGAESLFLFRASAAAARAGQLR
jgi:hypothetical protein